MQKFNLLNVIYMELELKRIKKKAVDLCEEAAKKENILAQINLALSYRGRSKLCGHFFCQNQLDNLPL